MKKKQNEKEAKHKTKRKTKRKMKRTQNIDQKNNNNNNNNNSNNARNQRVKSMKNTNIIFDAHKHFVTMLAAENKHTHGSRCRYLI